MSGTLSFHRALANTDGNQKPVKASHLDQTTVRAGDDVTLYRQRVPDDKEQWFGHGGQDRRSGNTAHKYADLVASGNGALTAGDALEGDIIVAITDSDGRILHERQVGDVDTLADAATESRTERPTMPAMAPTAPTGRYLEVIFNADPAADGAEVDPGDSSQRLWYTEVDA